ncbi:MAG: hypothetical protein Kow00129_03350 [Thermoleophilia bacterium]
MTATSENHLDLALHLVAGAVSEAPASPLREGLELYSHLLARDRIMDENQFRTLEQIIGRLDPEIVWRPEHRDPERGSYTPEDLDSLRGGHNIVHWLTTELSSSPVFGEADVDRIVGYIRGRLLTVPT